jgi:hypothetical protein
MKDTTARRKLRELHETFSGRVLDPDFIAKVDQLVADQSWRPDITEPQQRRIAAAINFVVSGKGGKRMCINKYLKTGEIPRFQQCRKRLHELGIIAS